ncbi:MAG: hypothetical protein ACYC3R_07370, partial [Thiomonas delicata]
GRKTKAQTNAQSRQKFRNARMDWTGRVDEEMLDVTYGFGTRTDPAKPILIASILCRRRACQ